MKILIAILNIDVNIKGNFDITALFWTLEKGHIDIVKLLLLLLTIPNIDVNIESKYSENAHILTSAEGHIEIIKLLLTITNIDVNIKNCGSNII